MSHGKDITIVLNKYFTIKELFIECEETDPSLKTNLQPMNEFRAILDHIMKIIYADQNKDTDKVCEQFVKLNAHLDRCFFDVCDMLSINYRNKIVDIMSLYDPDTIRDVLPDYYKTVRSKIEEITGRITQYRDQKGMPDISQEEISMVFESYKADVEFLRDTYKEVNSKQCSLEEITKKKQEALEESTNKQQEIEKRNRRKDFIVGGLIGGTIVTVVGGIILELLFGVFGL